MQNQKGSALKGNDSVIDEEDEYSAEEDDDDDYIEDDLYNQKSNNLVFGGGLKRNNKDPDFPDDGIYDPFGPMRSIKERIDSISMGIERMDTNYEMLEDKFKNEIDSKTIEIE